MEEAASSSAGTQRRRIDYLDGLRGILMLLGIPYHTAMAFSGTPWLITASNASPSILMVAEFLHTWRMPAFYLVAGYFATMMLRRRGAHAWLRGRIKRLGAPLITGVLIFSPLQWIILGAFSPANQGVTSEVLKRLWPPSGYWTLHLWFLVELLIYCFVLAGLFVSPLRNFAGRTATKLAIAMQRRPAFSPLITISIASLFVVGGLACWQAINGDTLFSGLLTRNLILFAPSFSLGAALGARPHALVQVGRLQLLVIIPIALAATAIVLVIKVFHSGDTMLLNALLAVSWTAGGLTMTMLAIRVAGRLLDFPRATVRWLVDASLPIYLIHQPLVLLFAFLCGASGLTGWAGWTITVAATAIGAGIFYEVVNCAAWTRFLTTGSTRRGSSLMQVVCGRRHESRDSVTK